MLVFRGTDNADAVDWKTNAMQGMGMEARQYTQAIETAIELADNPEYKGLEIAGHSKAGGQAAASIVTGLKGYTFNAAGVHEATVARFSKTRADAKKLIGGKPLVNAFNFPHDVLNYVQDIPQLRKAATVSGLLPIVGFAGGAMAGLRMAAKRAKRVARLSIR